MLLAIGLPLAAIAAMALLLVRSRGLRDHFAFGPPMVLGAYIAIAYGIELVDWYLR